ncbi:otoconin-90 isoform X2 [Hyalella azteca]|uniref:Phospholipase A2 n=1 Tax=Hyalella azteca TaxID=294128 RepID=A0A8B7P645_HYAAZ|nr:otoconin-90 isoform X2 [Hyalella azteca]
MVLLQTQVVLCTGTVKRPNLILQTADTIQRYKNIGINRKMNTETCIWSILSASSSTEGMQGSLRHSRGMASGSSLPSSSVVRLLLGLSVLMHVALPAVRAAPPQNNTSQAAENLTLSTASPDTDGSGSVRGTRSRRSVKDLYNMLTCSTNCDPLSYKGYGCYCGFMGAGAVVDGIDRCCKIHDWCYETARQCSGLQWYMAPYDWHCYYGHPICAPAPRWRRRSCGQQLCECDRAFAECLRHQPCPGPKAMCVSSPWRSSRSS